MFVLIHYADGKPGRMVEGPFPTREEAEEYNREWAYDTSRNAVLPIMAPSTAKCECGVRVQDDESCWNCQDRKNWGI